MENNSILNQEDQEQIELPPGFRFHPTDEELIVHYLSPKVLGNNFSAKAIGEVDLNKCEPWELPGRAKMGEKEWYFFCVRDRKYPTGLRTNRATEAGYWKATGKDKEIFKGRKTLIGMKKTLVFYKGRAPNGEKSNWVMHEFRLDGKFSVYYNLPKTSKKEWVICRVFKKNSDGKKTEVVYELSPSNSVLPPLMESSSPAEEIKPHSHVTCFSNSMEEQDNYIFSNKQNPLFCNTQINVNDLSLHFQQQEEDQNIILRMILENEEEAAASIQEEDDPSTSAAGPVDDLDCLWNYRY